MSLLETNSYDGLIAGDFPIVTDRQTLVTGENLTRGALLGKITDTGADNGKLKQCATTNTDGSETPYAILSIDTDASAADVVTDIYLTGQFASHKIGLASGDTVADFKDTLRDKSIYIVTVQEA